MANATPFLIINFGPRQTARSTLFYFGLPKMSFLSPNSGCHGLRFRRFICNIAITWLCLLKIVLWTDLSYNCDQNASLPSDSKSFSNNFVLSLSFSSLPDSFCCLITTCIIIDLSLNSYFFLIKLSLTSFFF